MMLMTLNLRKIQPAQAQGAEAKRRNLTGSAKVCPKLKSNRLPSNYLDVIYGKPKSHV